MALTKTKTLNKIEIVGSFKHLQARYKVEVMEDNEATNYERENYPPNTTIADLATELQGYATEAWTAEVVSAYEDSLPE
jgi:hypothetical protein